MAEPKQEVVTLLLDDDDAAYVYGVYESDTEAEEAMRAAMVARFGADTVAEYEADDELGLGALVPYKIQYFDWPRPSNG